MKDVVKKHKNNCIQFFLSQEVSFFKKCGIFILLLVIILFPFFTHTAQASPTVTLDNTSSGLLSWQHRTGHPNEILLVGVNSGPNYTAPLNVTYNGILLTRLVIQGCPVSLQCSAAFYYLKNPPVGTYTVLLDPTNVYSSTFSGGAATFYNVDLTNPFGSPPLIGTNTGYGGATTPTVTLNNTNTNQLKLSPLSRPFFND